MRRKLAYAATLMLLAAPAAAQPQQWPQNSVRSFMTTCVKTHKELIQPCRCMIDGIMREFSPEDFTKLANAGTIDRDARYTRIRNDCATRAKVRE